MNTKVNKIHIAIAYAAIKCLKFIDGQILNENEWNMCNYLLIILSIKVMLIPFSTIFC